jgi:hypothetical protein
MAPYLAPQRSVVFWHDADCYAAARAIRRASSRGWKYCRLFSVPENGFFLFATANYSDFSLQTARDFPEIPSIRLAARRALNRGLARRFAPRFMRVTKMIVKRFIP